MADEETAIAASEPDTPTIAPEAVQDEGPQAIPDVGPAEQETGEGETTEPEDDFEEFEWDGKPIRGPKGLKDGVLRQADYTRKTQDVAAKAKALESREAEINRMAQVTEAEVMAFAGLQTVSMEMERFKDYDYAAYQAHAQEDPLGAQQAWAYKQDLMARKSQLEATIGESQRERTARAQQETAKRWQETGNYAKEHIPGWSPETADKVFSYAEQMGVPRQFMQDNMSPVLLTIMHHAFIGQQALSTPTAKAPAPPAQPLKVVAAKSNPTNRTDLASMDMESYVAARKRGVGGRAL